MKIDAFFYFMCSLVLNVFLFVVCILMTDTAYNFKKHMIENGYAEYRIDSKNGNSEFYLIPAQEFKIEN